MWRGRLCGRSSRERVEPRRTRRARRGRGDGAMGVSDRREFLKAAAGVAAVSAISPVVFGQDQPTGERVVVGVMGTGGRGVQLASGFAALPNVVVKYVCDVDESHANAAAKT